MAERQTDPRGADIGDPIDRIRSDGEAGRGDMLGGLSTGAGGRLGPDQGAELASVPVPMSGDAPGSEGLTIAIDDAGDPANQHNLDAEEPRTDADRNYHGMDSPA